MSFWPHFSLSGHLNPFYLLNCFCLSLHNDIFSRPLMVLQPLRVPPQAPASEFSHSLKLAQLPFSWKLFQSLFPPSLSATISLFFSIVGFAIKWFRTKWNDQGPAFYGNLPSLSVILPSQCCSVPTSVSQKQTRPESMWRCVHIWASSHMDKSWITISVKQLRYYFSAALFKYWFTKSGKYKRKFSKGRDNNSGEYNWLYKQCRVFPLIFSSLFSPVFYYKAFPITWLFVKLRFNIWNLQPLFIDNIADSSIYSSPSVENEMRQTLELMKKTQWILNNAPLL